MRLIDFKELKEGMVVGQRLYGPKGEILLKEGMVLKERTLEKLTTYNASHLYIKDDLSEGIDINMTVTPEIRKDAFISIKKLFQAIEQGSNDYHDHMQACLDVIDKLTEDILSERITLFDIFDIKLKDQYIYQHPVNVAIISMILGRKLQLNALDLYRLGLGAFLIDVGQMFIPDQVMYKKEKYTQKDMDKVKQHPDLGYRFAKDEFYLPMRSYLTILEHHERFNGSGYPNGKTGTSIHQYARIVAIADVYDAISSYRPYRQAMPPAKAYQTIIKNAGKAFDPEFIRLFSQKVSPYPVGMTLKINDQKTVIVLKNYEGKPFNPLVRVIKDKGRPGSVPYETHL